MVPRWMLPFRMESTATVGNHGPLDGGADELFSCDAQTTCVILPIAPSNPSPASWTESILRLLRQQERTSSSEQPMDSSGIRLLLWQWTGKFMYIVFYLVVHLMKLHSLSLIWGVATEAMEYEELARNVTTNTSNNSHRSADSQSNGNHANEGKGPESQNTRLQRLSLIGFGGTLGGILGRYVEIQ
jgi:hypothetical protein